MNPRTIHETELSELVNKVVNGVMDVSDAMSSNHPTSMSKAASLSRAASATTMVFPVLISESISSESASMITKAIERNCVSMMQIALSAFNMSNAGNVVDFLKDFHTNVDSKKLDLDTFEDLTNAVAKQIGVNESLDYKSIAQVTEDFRNNTNYYFDDDVNEKPLSEFVFKRNGMYDVVVEGKSKKRRTKDNAPSTATGDNKQDSDTVNNQQDNDNTDNQKDFHLYTDDEIEKRGPGYYQTYKHTANAKDGRNLPSTDTLPGDKETKAGREKMSKDIKDRRDYNLKANQFQHQVDKDMYDRQRDAEKDKYQQARDAKKDDNDLRQANNNYFKNQLISSDVKKANELVPSMMIVNVMLKDPTGNIQNQQSVIGVKAKLYPVNPQETVTKIVTKHSDTNTILKLVKVGTREISFFRDFLLAIDDAKIEALSKSKRGSSSKLFKVLERRALGGKVRKILGRSNTCKPIFSLVISREEADYLLNYADIDVDNSSVVIPIMEKLNLMYFIIVDESTETSKFLVDGDTQYETLSFSSLEKEVSDGGYKKVVNLVSKITK